MLCIAAETHWMPIKPLLNVTPQYVDLPRDRHLDVEEILGVILEGFVLAPERSDDISIVRAQMLSKAGFKITGASNHECAQSS